MINIRSKKTTKQNKIVMNNATKYKIFIELVKNIKNVDLNKQLYIIVMQIFLQFIKITLKI